jgi:hypothetical protein
VHLAAVAVDGPQAAAEAAPAVVAVAAEAVLVAAAALAVVGAVVAAGPVVESAARPSAAVAVDRREDHLARFVHDALLAAQAR